MRSPRAAALAVGLTTLGSATPALAQPSPHKTDALERSVIAKINTLRAQHGVRKVRTVRGLARASNAHSGAMARTGSFSHGAMTSRVRRYVRARYVGETLAWVPVSQRRKARAVLGAWMRSPAHRATLLSARFARIGVGRRTGTIGGRRAVVFTVDLASAR